MDKKIITTVQLREQQISPKKARLVMDMIRGMDLNKAVPILDNTNKKSARIALSLLKSATSSAKEKGYQTNELIICESLVNEGRKLKRYFIRARGRSTKYLKRSSHFRVSLCLKANEKKVEQPKMKGKDGK